MENRERLVARLDERIPQTSGVQKKKYQLLRACLEDDEFVELLEPQEVQRLNNLANNLSDRDLAWFEANQSGMINDLASLNFKCIAYLDDRRKNVANYESRFQDLDHEIKNARTNIERINETARLISGASILAEYAKDFDSEAGEHRENASIWIKWLCGSIVVFAVLVAILIFLNISEFPPLKSVFADDLRKSGELTVLVLAIKASLVFAYLQVPYFLKRNYFAEKHLEQACIHRRDVLKALHAVYNTIQNQTEKDTIIMTGAAIAFSEAESGYITRKEGAGSDDSLGTFITKLWNK